MMNFALKLAYDGSEFWGWQATSHGPSIEASLQKVLEQILQRPISLQAASRTDRGVHAEAQWANFFSDMHFKVETFLKSVNALLPPTIRVLSLHEVPLFFHPTLHAEKKEYHYKIHLGSIQLPKERFFAWHVPYALDLSKIEAARQYFLGEHNFSSLCNYRKGLNYKNKNRLIEKISVIDSVPDMIIFSIIGRNFLYKMVRNIVGTLIDVGRGKIQPEAIPKILASQQRANAGITAPAHGLTLKKIYYPKEYRLEL